MKKHAAHFGVTGCRVEFQVVLSSAAVAVGRFRTTVSLREAGQPRLYHMKAPGNLRMRPTVPGKKAA